MTRHLSRLFKILSLLCALHCNALGQEHSSTDVRIAWDYSSMQQIAEMGGYPRLTRLKDSTLLVIYETRTGYVHLKKSTDDGKSWSAPMEVFSQFVYASADGKSTLVNIANPEIKQLNNGDVVIACNYRPQKAEIAPYSIVIRRSTDNGQTWLPPQCLYSAAPRFTDGCWEPSFLQLPGGELQVYFANENPYRNSDEQEISMLRSQDNGITWSEKTTTVSFRKGRRDGMPVPVILGNDIVVAIEDNKIGQFKPYTVRTPISKNWAVPVLADSPNRNYALDNLVADTIYMGAPYLIKLPNGQTLLSYQTNDRRMHDWELSTMEVAIGDTEGKKFGKRTRPFDVPLNKEAKWNSLSVWDNRTVAALSSSDFKARYVAPWLIKGYIIPDIKLKNSKIDDYPIFIGAKGRSNLKAGLTFSDGSIIMECNVSEPKVTSASDSSGVFLFLKLDKQVYKIWSSKGGQNHLFIKKHDQWKRSALISKLSINIKHTPQGYKISYRVPPSFQGAKASQEFSIGLAFSTRNKEKRYVEYLANMEEGRPETWIKILL
ncbi:sialidase family protein [Arcticibacter tournemirensis]